jgi:hypothetical protein
VHPLVLLTLASLLVVLFGIGGLILSHSRPPSEIELSAGSGVAGLKRLLAAGAWRVALPWLLITGGLLAMMVFGALVLAVLLGDRVTGALMLAVPVVALARILYQYWRA